MEQAVDKSPVDNSPDAVEQWPSRPQRRLLRRIYNGRTVPLEANGHEFLTYKAALAYLLTLDLPEREACYEAMKAEALTKPDRAD